MPIDISIIIPLYNKQDYILDTLKSVVFQDLKNWECIIVDDGSTDASLGIVNDFCGTHVGNWKVLSIPNGGQTKARNIGVKAAQGKYLSFLDADDLWVRNKLSVQFDFLEANPKIVGVLSSYAIFKSNSRRIRVIRGRSFIQMLHKWANMSGFGGGLESVGMVRHFRGQPEVLFDENLSTSSGLDFAVRFSQLGEMVLLKDIGLLYRLSEGQWHTNAEELKANTSIISEKFSDYFGEHLQARHHEYFHWIEVRKHGYPYLLHEVAKDLVNLRISRLKMLFWLLSRNIVALFRGHYSKKLILEQLKQITS